ncbi:MAG: hypothetical protein WCG27_07990 [Pseudomonadota bacterium]
MTSWPGIGLGFIFFIGLFLWGDKLVLAMMDANPLHPKINWNEVVQNYACRLGIGHVDVYISHRFSQSVYAVASRQNCSLVVGRKIFEELETEEVKSMLLGTMLMFRGGDARFGTYVGPLLVMVYLPFILINRRWGAGFFPRLKFFITLYFYSLSFFQHWVMDQNILEKYLLELKKYMNDLGRLSSALMKIGYLPVAQEEIILSSILENLAIGGNYKKDAILNLIKESVPFKEKYLTPLHS